MGFEPTTSAVTGRRSNQLSHQAILRICTFKTTHQSNFSKPFQTSILQNISQTFMVKPSTY